MNIGFKTSIDFGNMDQDYDQNAHMHLKLNVTADELNIIGKIEGYLIPCGWSADGDLNEILKEINELQSQTWSPTIKEIMDTDTDAQDCDFLVILTSATLSEEWRGMNIGLAAMASLVQRLRLLSTPLIVGLADSQTQDTLADTKIAKHWGKVGFKKLPNSNHIYLCGNQDNPKADKIIRSFTREASPKETAIVSSLPALYPILEG